MKCPLVEVYILPKLNFEVLNFNLISLAKFHYFFAFKLFYLVFNSFQNILKILQVKILPTRQRLNSVQSTMATIKVKGLSIAISGNVSWLSILIFFSYRKRGGVLDGKGGIYLEN